MLRGLPRQMDRVLSLLPKGIASSRSLWPGAPARSSQPPGLLLPAATLFWMKSVLQEACHPTREGGPAWSGLVQLGGLPGGEQHRDSWARRQNTWQPRLCGQQGLAFGFPLLLWILFWGLTLGRTHPLSLGLGRNPGMLNGGWLGVCLRHV